MKAIIPAAGLGARLLPATKAVPKELLPVEGKPAIQWVLEEAVRAGLRELIVVVSPRKAALREFLTRLESADPLFGHPALAHLEKLLCEVRISFVDQPWPEGLGCAVLRCRRSVGDEPFALLLPDNIFAEDSHLVERLIETHLETGSSCIGLWQARGAGLLDGAVLAEQLQGATYKVLRVLAKGVPAEHEPEDRSEYKSRLRGIGRCVLQPSAFRYLERAEPAGELDDVPALDGLAREGSLLGLLVTERFRHLGADESPSECMQTG